MSIDKKRIYRKRNPFITALKVCGIVLVSLLAVFTLLFFSFQKYIVYTQDGVKLDVPYLREYRS